MFCPKCKGLLMPKKVDGKITIQCSSCGYVEKKTEDMKIKEKVIKEKSKKLEIVKEEKEAYPLTDAECPKCKHKMAYFWEVQTRAGDEPATKFLRCEKCKHTWRDYY